MDRHCFEDGGSMNAFTLPNSNDLDLLSIDELFDLHAKVVSLLEGGLETEVPQRQHLTEHRYNIGLDSPSTVEGG
jgi:hypothetical protein